MAGRQTTERMKKAFLAAYAKGWNIGQACKACGIGRRTFYDWTEKDPDFKADVDEARESRIDLGESMLLRNMSEGDTASIIYFLKTQGRSRGWSEKLDLSVASDLEVVIPDTLKGID